MYAETPNNISDENINVNTIRSIINEGDEMHVMDVVKDIYFSDGEYTKKDSYLIAITAFLARHENELVRKCAFDMVSDLREIEHLFLFKKYYQKYGFSKGWGRMAKNAFTKWYANYDTVKLFENCLTDDIKNHKNILKNIHINPTNVDDDKNIVLYFISRQNVHDTMEYGSKFQNVDNVDNVMNMLRNQVTDNGFELL